MSSFETGASTAGAVSLSLGLANEGIDVGNSNVENLFYRTGDFLTVGVGRYLKGILVLIGG